MANQKTGIVYNRGGRIIYWFRNHKFWTSVIVFSIILIFLYIFKPFNPLGLGNRLGYTFLSYVLFCYAFIGGLIWSGYAGKKGLSLITLGSSLILLALFSWINVFQHSDVVNISLAIVSTLLGLLFLVSGIKRTRKSVRNN